ncbi:low temperature requirement protein A [Micromonospora citrea]|uniref:low temperature requirement protein A n=1 Tax=Micromonospora citrea TaxID=47855 RepID=UPI003C399DB6
MSKPGTPRREPVRTVSAGTRVARVEVFFDLIFVYGFFNLSRYVAEDLTVHGLVKGLLVLALLWLCWVAHMLVAQRIRLGEGIAPLVTFAAMGAALAIALTIPHAFGDPPGDISGPVLFPICYFTLRWLHLGLHWYVVRKVPVERRQLTRIGVAVFVSTGLLLVAAFLPWISPDLDTFGVRVGLWILAVLVEYGTGLAVGLAGWRLAAPGHFAERFELIVIIAFGELIISIGIGSGVLGQPITWPPFFASLVGLVAIASLWWLYFDSLAYAAELTIHALPRRERVALARDGYIYLHLPIIAGLILLAAGGEEMVRFLGVAEAHVLEPVHGLGATLLYAGVGLYLLALIAFQLRALGTMVWTRVVGVLLIAGAVPLAGRLPAVVALGLLAVICLGVVIAEIVFLADSRRGLQEAIREEREAHEARETEWRRRRR